MKKSDFWSLKHNYEYVAGNSEADIPTVQKARIADEKQIGCNSKNYEAGTRHHSCIHAGAAAPHP